MRLMSQSTASSEMPAGSLVRVPLDDFGLEENDLGTIVRSFLVENAVYPAYRCYVIVLAETGDAVTAHEIQTEPAY